MRVLTAAKLCCGVFVCAAVTCLFAAAPETRPVAPAGWVERAGGNAFKLFTPADVKPEAVQGVDSLVNRWIGPGLTIDSDFGWHSDPLDRRDARNHRRTEVAIDGKQAFLVRYEQPEDKTGLMYVGVHFPDPTGDKKIRLTVFARCADVEKAELAVRIFQTITFNHPPAAR